MSPQQFYFLYKYKFIYIFQTFYFSSLIFGCEKNSGKKLNSIYSYDDHIQPIFSKKCSFCHLNGGIGPHPLTNYEETTKIAPAILNAIKTSRMPPWAAARSCRSYHGDYSLTENEQTMVTSWLETGTPKTLDGTEKYEPEAFDTLKLTRVDVELKNSEPYLPKPNPDDTRCFVIDWPFKEVKYVTGTDVIPGDKSLVHHSSMYIAPQADRDFYKDLDAKNGSKTDGYPCSATMGVGKPTARWIGGWLPGLSGFEFPLKAGIRIEPESVVILQVHYNIPTEANQPHAHFNFTDIPVNPDLTKIHFKIEDTVERVGTLVTFTNPDWMVELEMEIPRGAKRVGHEFSGQLDKIPNLIGQEFPLKGDIFEIQSINMHGHALMVAAKMKLIKENGMEECLLDLPNFQPKWQLNYIFKEAVKVTKNDKIYLRCEWDNSDENQMIVNGRALPSIDVNWGDGARSEMCFGLMFVTEYKP
jgi:hypothetical protein